jgi:hypothetical protein
MDKILEALTKPVTNQAWLDDLAGGREILESDTGENSRQYLQQRLFMSFKEFWDSQLSKENSDGPHESQS